MKIVYKYSPGGDFNYVASTYAGDSYFVKHSKDSFEKAREELIKEVTKYFSDIKNVAPEPEEVEMDFEKDFKKGSVE